MQILMQSKKNNYEDNEPIESDIQILKQTLEYPSQIIKLKIIQMKNGAFYEGEWQNGFKQGKGKHTWPDGSYYEGNWH